jgi:predicted TIM-barrel fold metal-dependent hydrolase
MITDVNVNLSRWPFRRLPFDDTASLVRKLRQSGVSQAWAGSFDGMLHRDIAGVNARLTDECKQYGPDMLLPVGSINPTLPDWHEDLRRCHEDHGMRIIRLHPNYHDYRLDQDECHALFSLATKRRLVIQIALKMEDVRLHHPLMQVPTVDVTSLQRLVERYPDLRLVVMNNYGTISNDSAASLAATGKVYFEISHSERVGTLETLVRQVPYERLLFGSHFPFFNLDASLLKFRESHIGEEMTKAIQRRNAHQILTDVT